MAREKYSTGCVRAVLRALGERDPRTILARVHGCQTLEDLNREFVPGMPALLTVGATTNRTGTPPLGQVETQKHRSRLAQLYRATCREYKPDLAVAMFVRTGEGENVVVHTLTGIRMAHDEGVRAHIVWPSGLLAIVESRPSFCRLLAGNGEWAVGLRDVMPPIDLDDPWDLRQYPPSERSGYARQYLQSKGMRPTWDKALKHLSDHELVAFATRLWLDNRNPR